MKNLLLLLSLLVTFVYADIVTPYPTTIELKQINGTEKERIRLGQGHKKYDKQATGFYIEKGKAIEVTVEITTPAHGDVMPVLTVGTLGFNPEDRNTGVHTTLKSGVNRITSHQGGLVWLSFVENGSRAPVGKATITFTENSEEVRAPHYVYGTTTDKEFYEMMFEYQTDDVLYTSDYIAVAATRRAALQYSTFNTNTEKLKEWMDAIHTLLEEEDKISGLDNNDINPVHHRFKLGEVRYLLVENTSTSPHANSAGYTGYPYASRNRYLTKIGVAGNNTWMLGHELGHQHQQPAYQIDKSTESTVNIYSYVVERNIVGATNYSRTTAARWTAAQNTYLSLPVAKRVYNMPDNDLEGITGFNRDELRFMMWEQIFIAFGDDFYKTLHRVVREEKIVGGGADERRAYLIWKASRITGYDLTEYFNQWGVRIMSDNAVKTQLRARMANALAKGDIEPLPMPVEELVMLTGQNKPSWVPLPLKGITKSAPASDVLDKADWTITTSYQGVPDAAIGGDDPMYIIDNDHNSTFSFIKPGKSYDGVSGPADYIPSFTIDMQSLQSFNYILYRHRTGNTSNYIRARQFSIYGSDDGDNFTPIVESYTVNYGANENELEIILDEEVSHRYIKLVYEDWDKSNGSSIQISELSLGSILIEDLPTPAPLQYKVMVDIDEGIVTEQVGGNLIDEDATFVLSFSLRDANVTDVQVFVDGDLRKPRQEGDKFTLSLKIANHTEIKILAKTNTGIISNNTPEFIQIYPNPVQVGESFSLLLEESLAGASLAIFNMSGQKVSETLAEGLTVSQTIDQTGVYLIRVQKAGETRVQKLIVN